MNIQQDIGSKFRFILLAAKRARQLQAGALPLVQTQSKRPTIVAMAELESGLVPFEIIKPAEDAASSEKNSKR